jgi:hypothetical protein
MVAAGRRCCHVLIVDWSGRQLGSRYSMIRAFFRSTTMCAVVTRKPTIALLSGVRFALQPLHSPHLLLAGVARNTRSHHSLVARRHCPGSNFNSLLCSLLQTVFLKCTTSDTQSRAAQLSVIAYRNNARPCQGSLAHSAIAGNLLTHKIVHDIRQTLLLMMHRIDERANWIVKNQSE